MRRTPTTLAEAAALVKTAGGKYGNRKTYLESADRWFDSAHEAHVAAVLLLRQRKGEIRDLLFQQSFPLVVNGVLVGRYVADFTYTEYRLETPLIGPPRWAWRSVVADAKGFKTPVYRLKKRLMDACHAIEVVEL